MEIINARGGLTETELAKFEKSHQISLPRDYRDFLLKYNGGHPVADTFVLRNIATRKELGSSDKSSVHYFYSIKDDTSSLGDTLEVLANRIPAETIAIADDPGGNQILLAVKGDHIGTVYFGDHEDEYEEGETPGYRNVSFIADSFTGFLDGLTKYELPAKYRK